MWLSSCVILTTQIFHTKIANFWFDRDKRRDIDSENVEQQNDGGICTVYSVHNTHTIVIDRPHCTPLFIILSNYIYGRHKMEQVYAPAHEWTTAYKRCKQINNTFQLEAISFCFTYFFLEYFIFSNDLCVIGLGVVVVCTLIDKYLTLYSIHSLHVHGVRL